MLLTTSSSNALYLFQNQAELIGVDHYFMNFIVSLAKIPGGVFAAIFLKKFPTRPVFLICAIHIIVAHVMMGLTNMMLLPPVFAMIAIAIIQFTSSAGYISVSYLLLGVLLPSSSRSTFTGLVAMVEGLSALSLNAVRPYITSSPMGDAGLFFVFATIVTACVIYMFFMMPETRGITMEQIEYIFLCPPHEGCAIRRDPNRIITNAVESVTNFVERVRMTYQFDIVLDVHIINLTLSLDDLPTESAHCDHSHTWILEEANSEREVRIHHNHGEQRGVCGLM